jgi:hypothetical protein
MILAMPISARHNGRNRQNIPLIAQAQFPPGFPDTERLTDQLYARKSDLRCVEPGSRQQHPSAK